MTAVSQSPQQITATLRTHRDRTINMIIQQQRQQQPHRQHPLSNAPLPPHTVTAYKPHATAALHTDSHTPSHPRQPRVEDERRAAERGRRADERVRHERQQASSAQHARKLSSEQMLHTDRQHRARQLQQQHARDQRLPAHLRADWTQGGVSVEEWRRRVREENEAVEAEEGQARERMQQTRQRIVAVQAEERAEEERQQQDKRRRDEAEAAQRLADERKRDDRRRWAASLTSAPARYTSADSSSARSTDSSDDSSSESDSRTTARRQEETAAEMTRLWDDFKHRWTPPKQPAAAVSPVARDTTATAPGRGAEGGSSVAGLHSLTASTDASIRELTAMLNDMISEFNITANAAGSDSKAPLVRTALEQQTSTRVRAALADERRTVDSSAVMAAVSVASLTAATAAAGVVARKPSPLSSPASSPTRLSTAQRQRSVQRGDAQEAEWEVILHELKQDKQESKQQTVADRVGLFVPSILSQRDERIAQEEKREQTTERKQSRRRRSAVEAEDEVDGADGVVYSGLIDFDVNDPHEIDRQRRIEAQLAADSTARTEQHYRAPQRTPHKLPNQEREESALSSDRVREAIDRYKQSALSADEPTAERSGASRVDGQHSEPGLDSTVDVRRWLERLERKIDALANQQQQPTVASQSSSKAMRSSERKGKGAPPAASIFAPVERQHDDRAKAESPPDRSKAATATEAASDERAAAARYPRDGPRANSEQKSAVDGPAQPPLSPVSSAPAAQLTVTPPPRPRVATPHAARPPPQLRASAISVSRGGDGSGELSLQECFARRMGHVIASEEQRQRERQQRHTTAHAHCADTAEDEYYHHARHDSRTAHSRPASRSQPLQYSGDNRRRIASVQYSSAMPHLSGGRTAVGRATGGVQQQQQQVRSSVRAVVGEREARARSSRVWRQLPEVRSRREEQRRREQRRANVQRRQSYDRERRAGQHDEQRARRSWKGEAYG